MFIVLLTGRAGLKSIGLLLVFLALFILVCAHVLPLLIVRRNPERVLEVLLPPFDVVARFLHPLTGPLVKLITAEGRRERTEPPVNNAPTATIRGSPRSRRTRSTTRA